jgi:hypothetical protein
MDKAIDEDPDVWMTVSTSNMWHFENGDVWFPPVFDSIEQEDMCAKHTIPEDCWWVFKKDQVDVLAKFGK